MTDGGLVEPDCHELTLAAIAADHYGVTVFEFIDHLTRVREKYGEAAARFELDFALTVRERRVERANEAAKRANG